MSRRRTRVRCVAVVEVHGLLGVGIGIGIGIDSLQSAFRCLHRVVAGARSGLWLTDALRQTRALVEFVDIFPSLAELARLPPPAGLEGTSFARLLDDPNAPWDKAAFSEYPKGGNRGVAMRTDRYRYIEWRDKKGELVARELYDHEADPQENQNVADRPENAALCEQLAAQMKAAVPNAAAAAGRR